MNFSPIFRWFDGEKSLFLTRFLPLSTIFLGIFVIWEKVLSPDGGGGAGSEAPKVF